MTKQRLLVMAACALNFWQNSRYEFRQRSGFTHQVSWRSWYVVMFGQEITFTQFSHIIPNFCDECLGLRRFHRFRTDDSVFNRFGH